MRGDEVTTMKLSEAILVGCKGTKKITNGFLYEPHDVFGASCKKPRGCCVLGAGAFGMHGDCAKATCVDLGIPSRIRQECIRRNNETKQSRQSIARWLAKQGY